MDVKLSSPTGPGSSPKLAEQDDGTLAKLVAAGDREAGAVLVRRYQALVRSFLLRLTGRPEVADDVAQETFLKLLRYADRYDPQYPMRTWLLTIARRTWLNQMRLADNRVVAGEFGGMAGNDPDPGLRIAREDEQQQLRKRLDAALRQLTPQQRTAMVLFHQHEMPINEIAQVMKMPEGTIKSHLHRARAALRRLLKVEAVNS